MTKMTWEGKQILMPHYQAMVESLLADFPSASPAMKMRIMQMALMVVPELSETIPPGPTPQAIEEFCAALAAAACELEDEGNGYAPHRLHH